MADVKKLGFDEARLARVRAQLEDDVAADRCHGAQLLVARRGEIVLETVLGYADRAGGHKLASDAVFTSLSVGKQFTSALVLSLVERGALRLHAPVASVIPEFGQLGKERVTLFQLLTQTSGLQQSIPAQPPEVLLNIERMTAYACRSALESLPGARVNYSIAVAHSVMAAMCLRVDGRGRTFTRMMEEEVFQPLGMRDTSLGARDDLLKRWCPIRAAYKDVGLFDPGALESLPGARVNYSIAVAHSVMAAMCLRVDGRGRTFTRMMEEEIFRPLGMRDTSLGARDDLLKRWCPIRAAYKDVGLFDPGALEGIEQLIRMPGAELPAGGYLTTVRDMHRFAEMLRRGGELDGARVLSPAMIDYATRNQTGDRPNELWNYTTGFRGWEPFPAYLGVGFFLRGEVPTPGPFGALNSPRTYGGIGAGSTAFWVDPERELTFAFASTGLMEDSFHVERVSRLSDQVVSAIVA